MLLNYCKKVNAVSLLKETQRRALFHSNHRRWLSSPLVHHPAAQRTLNINSCHIGQRKEVSIMQAGAKANFSSQVPPKKEQEAEAVAVDTAKSADKSDAEEQPRK